MSMPKPRSLPVACGQSDIETTRRMPLPGPNH